MLAILAETEAVATQTASALAERADSEARQIAATTAAADSVQAAVHALGEDQRSTTSQVMDAQRLAAQDLQARVALLADAVSGVREHQKHFSEQAAADIATCTQIVRTALSEMQAHLDLRLEHLRRDQEVRLAQLQSTQARDRDRLLRELKLMSSRCSGESASRRRMIG